MFPKQQHFPAKMAGQRKEETVTIFGHTVRCIAHCPKKCIFTKCHCPQKEVDDQKAASTNMLSSCNSN